MNFIFGRENLALTIFVPFDCYNNCPFCTSKKTYKTNPPSVSLVKSSVQSFFDDYAFPIKDVVFTGGEPMANIHILSELLDLVPSKYNIYINTTFTNKNLDEFIDLVNKIDKIKGVNISRHSETYDSDCAVFHDIADDSMIKRIKKPVKINCVVGKQVIEQVVFRWENKNVELCFREDYTTMQDDEYHLHDPYGIIPIELLRIGYHFHSHSQCNVCDTTRFVKDGNIVSFHKGKQHSSILHGDNLEINDLIINQEGDFDYDWDSNYTDKLATYALLCNFRKRHMMTQAPITEAVMPTSGCRGNYCTCAPTCGLRSRSYCGLSSVQYCGGYRGC